MIRIQTPRFFPRQCFSHLRRCCGGDGSDGRIIASTPVTSAVRTFMTKDHEKCSYSGPLHGATGRKNIVHQRQHSFQIILQPNHRCFSSTSPFVIDPKIPQPKKYIKPSNLVFDPRSHFLNMFDNNESKNGTAATNHSPPMKATTTATMEASSSAHPEEDDDDEYDDNDEEYDDDDDDDLFDDKDALVFPYSEGVVYTKPLPERLHVDIHTLFRSPSLVGSIHLNESVFGLDPIRVDLLKRSVDYYRAKKRGKRNAMTKTISEVSGSGRKIRNQKGGGVARAGHSRPPHYRGGAKAHGPKNNTDYGNVKLNKKVRKLATRHVFSQKLKEGNLLIFNHMHELPTHKTNDLARLLSEWKVGGVDGGASALLLDHYYNRPDNDPSGPDVHNDMRDPSMPLSHGGVPTNLHVAAGNIPGLRVSNSHGANVYDILKHEKLIITLSALEQIETRLKLY